jgi:hypothetical protein
MKIVALALLFSTAAVLPSYAISRLNPKSMSCDSAQTAVHEQGAVIFRWTSPRGLPLYDRFVRNSRYCDANKYAEWKSIPTHDNRSCRVLNCQNIDNLDGNFIIPDNSL